MSASKGLRPFLLLPLLLVFISSQANRISTVPTQSYQSSLSADDIIKRLKAGNKRFQSDSMKSRDYVHQAKKSAAGQFPWAVILNCMDSRSVPEILFDAGIADIFTLRVAGNVLSNDIIGSMEFATKVAGSKVIVVMGHTACGAVHGACEGVKLGHLNHVLNKIKPAIIKVNSQDKERDCSKASHVNNIAKINAMMVAKQITQRSPVIASLVKKGDVKIIAAMHNLNTGEVSFY